MTKKDLFNLIVVDSELKQDNKKVIEELNKIRPDIINDVNYYIMHSLLSNYWFIRDRVTIKNKLSFIIKNRNTLRFLSKICDPTNQKNAKNARKYGSILYFAFNILKYYTFEYQDDINNYFNKVTSYDAFLKHAIYVYDNSITMSYLIKFSEAHNFSLYDFLEERYKLSKRKKYNKTIEHTFLEDVPCYD